MPYNGRGFFFLPTAREFLETITEDILSYEDYINWERIDDVLAAYAPALGLLESVRNTTDLARALVINPDTLSVLQFLIAHTQDALSLPDGREVNFRTDSDVLEAGDTERAAAIAHIFNEIGTVQELAKAESVRDLLAGVLIGLEPNTRKNRRGKAFERRMQELLTAVTEAIDDDGSLAVETLRLK